jgi:hypothetical protein
MAFENSYRCHFQMLSEGTLTIECVSGSSGCSHNFCDKI